VLRRWWRLVLRAIAVRVSRWAARVLGGGETIDVVAPVDVAPPRPPQKGPPARWVERVRRDAPHLLRAPGDVPNERPRAPLAVERSSEAAPPITPTPRASAPARQIPAATPSATRIRVLERHASAMRHSTGDAVKPAPMPIMDQHASEPAVRRTDTPREPRDRPSAPPSVRTSEFPRMTLREDAAGTVALPGSVALPPHADAVHSDRVGHAHQRENHAPDNHTPRRADRARGSIAFALRTQSRRRRDLSTGEPNADVPAHTPPPAAGLTESSSFRTKAREPREARHATAGDSSPHTGIRTERWTEGDRWPELPPDPTPEPPSAASILAELDRARSLEREQRGER
jgi:hypothetical protein